MDDVTNILHRTYEVYMRINTDRKSQRTTVGQKARQADHLAWSEDPPFLRELYSLFTPHHLTQGGGNGKQTRASTKFGIETELCTHSLLKQSNVEEKRKPETVLSNRTLQFLNEFALKPNSVTMLMESNP
uniref:SFRICE_000212 n=1 Tax=Spodoptera frugiperda TaxID=7108 RepID=A0A2H1VZH7_SPOFR